MLLCSPALAQEEVEPVADNPSTVFDAVDFSLEELLNTQVEVASLFLEDELVVGSSVASITPEKWKDMGARSLFDTIKNEPGIMVYPVYGGSGISIRGYASELSSVRGISVLIDGIPMNALLTKTALYQLPNWEIGTLNAVEMIKGPGSAIYGEDAFHGVLSLKTFESKEDHYSVEAAGAYPLYGDGSIKISQGIADDLVRIDLSAGSSRQFDQDIDYTYDEGTTLDWSTGDPISYPAGSSSRVNDYTNITGVLKVTINPVKNAEIKLNTYANKFKGDKLDGIGLYLPDDYLNKISDIYMGKGLINYTFDNDISIEMNYYLWQYKQTQDTMFGSYPAVNDLVLLHSEVHENRSGINLLLKQPENYFRLQWILGSSFSKIKVGDNTISDIRRDNGGQIIIPFPVPPYAGYEREIKSFFCQLKWGAVKETLYLLAGGRYDDYSDFGNQVTPRVGVIYLPIPEMSLKLLYGRAFRAPAALELKGSGIQKGNPDIKPETIDYYEFISIYKGKNAKANLTVFYSRWNDGILFGDIQYDNIGENKSVGGEMTFLYDIAPVITHLGCAVVKSKTIKGAINTNAVKIRDKEFSTFPEYSIIAGFHYTTIWDIQLYLNNRIYLNMKEDTTVEADDLPVYWRLDLDISKIINNKLELRLNCRNLANRKNSLPGLWHNMDDDTYMDANGIRESGVSVLLRAGYKI